MRVDRFHLPILSFIIFPRVPLSLLLSLSHSPPRPIHPYVRPASPVTHVASLLRAPLPLDTLHIAGEEGRGAYVLLTPGVKRLYPSPRGWLGEHETHMQHAAACLEPRASGLMIS